MKLGGRVVAIASLVWLALAGCGDDGASGPVDAPVTTPIDAAVAIDAPADGPGSQCANQPCSILPQCGCADNAATPVCDLDPDHLATGATECRADLFHGTETTTCTRTSTCAGEYTCLGRCAHYCDDDDDCPGPGGLCILPILFNGQAPIPGVRVCTTDCSPPLVDNPTCPSSWACHLYQEAEGERRWLTNCDGAAVGAAVGTACERATECAAGLDCVGEGLGTGKRCHPHCTCPGGDCASGTCPAGTGTCRPYTPAATVGTVTYGKCY